MTSKFGCARDSMKKDSVAVVVVAVVVAPVSPAVDAMAPLLVTFLQMEQHLSRCDCHSSRRHHPLLHNLPLLVEVFGIFRLH